MERHNLMSQFLYSLISLNLYDNKKWSYPIIDIGCGIDGLYHRELFPNAKEYTLIDMYWDSELKPSNLNSRLIITKRGFPNVPSFVLQKIPESVLIALFSLTMNKQYIDEKIYNELIKANDLYITFWPKDLDAYLKYAEAFKKNECIYTRHDGFKIMHYFN